MNEIWLFIENTRNKLVGYQDIEDGAVSILQYYFINILLCIIVNILYIFGVKI